MRHWFVSRAGEGCVRPKNETCFINTLSGLGFFMAKKSVQNRNLSLAESLGVSLREFIESSLSAFVSLAFCV